MLMFDQLTAGLSGGAFIIQQRNRARSAHNMRLIVEVRRCRPLQTRAGLPSETLSF